VEAFADRDIARIVLTGSESTGKTTVAAELSRHYGGAFVPEFVRSYAAALQRPLDFSDHGPIARGQIALEDEHIAHATGIVIQDTDLLSTVVYCRHYFGRCPSWIEDAAAARTPALYLVCQPDIPWVADGVRDRGERRDEMQRLFAEAVAAAGAPSLELSGTLDERLTRAIGAIDRLVGARMR
jgi:NadR type nicotinamide-nucleotide adenylyltransferase